MKLHVPSMLKPPRKVSAEDEVPRTTAQSVTLVISISLLMVMNVLSQGSLNIALPSMGRDLNIPNSRLEWPITAMTLASGCLILPFGRLADIFGARRMFLGGMCVFILANVAAGLARTEIQLAIFRAFQGAAGAASIPSAVSILAHAFPATSPYRAIAFACFSAGAPIGSGFGSLFGGLYTQLSTWRALFYFTAAVTCVPLILGYFVVPMDRLDPARDKRVDYLGSLLVTAGLVLLLFSLSSGPTAPQAWKTPYIIAFLVLSILLLGAFVFWEHTIVRSPRFSLPPMLPLEIFSRQKISLVLLVGFLIWASFQPFLLYTVLYYQQYLLLSPMATMVRQLPTAVSGVLCNFAFAMLVPFIPGWVLMTIGASGTAFSCVVMANIVPTITYWAMAFPAIFMVVFGADFIYATSTIYIAAIARPGEQALAGALFQVFTQLGVSFGLAITTVVKDSAQLRASPELAGRLHDNEIPTETLLKGIRASLWTTFAFSTLAILVTVIFLRPIKILGHRRTKKGTPGTASASRSNSIDTVVDPRSVEEAVEGEKVDGEKTEGETSATPTLDKTFFEAEATMADEVVPNRTSVGAEGEQLGKKGGVSV